MKRLIILLHLIFLMICVSRGQSYENRLNEIIDSDDNQQIVYCLTELSLAVELQEHLDTLSQVFHLLGKYYNRLKDYQSSIAAYEYSLALRNKLNDHDLVGRSRTEYLLARVLLRSGNEGQSKILLKKINAEHPTGKYGLLSLLQLGQIAVENEQYELALNYYKRCRYSNDSEDPYSLSEDIAQLLGVVYYEQGENAKAIEELSRLVDNEKVWNELYDYDRALILEEMAFNYMALMEYELALEKLVGAEVHYRNDSPENYEDFARNLHNQSIVFFRLDKVQECINILYNVLLIHINNKDVQGIGDSYCNLSESYFQLNEIDSAYHYSQLALTEWTSNESFKLCYKDLVNAYDLSELVIHLRDRIEFDTSTCQVDSYLLIDSLVTHIFSKQHFMSGTEYWINFASDMYDDAIDHAIRCNEIEKALFFSEKSKGLYIYGLRRESQSLNRDRNEYLKLKSLEESIGDLERQIFTEYDRQKDLELLGLRTEYHSFMEAYYSDHKMEKFPFYRHDLFKAVTGQQILSYHMTEQYYYVFSLVNGEIDVSINFQKESLDSILIDYNFRINSALPQWKKGSRYLHDMLIDGNVSHEVSGIVIIPNKKLGRLSFATLLDSEQQFLIERYNLSYYFSIFSYLEYSQEEYAYTNCKIIRYLKNEDSKLTYANQDLYDLPYFDVKRVDSTIELEIKDQKHNGIFHFATHAFTNDTLSQFSYLELGEEKLFVNDLFSTKWNNDLTFLGACNTGSHTSTSAINISLGLGVAAAGSKNHVQTLWNINDRSSSIIINQFYKELSKGISYRNALRSAQLHFINTSPLTWKHPYYWASFQYFGRPDAHISIPWYSKLWN